MRKILISAAVAAAATLTAVPAAAQHGNRDRDGWEQRRDGDRWDRRDDRRDHDRRGWHDRGPDRQAINILLRRLNQVDNMIQRSSQRRFMSPREAQSLRRESLQIRNALQRRSRNGLSGREFANLQQRVNRLEQRVRYERRDRDGRRG